MVTPADDSNTSMITQPLLANQFSPEYPYVIPQPQENVQPSSPNPIEIVTALTKNMKLNVS
ncbi:unnamed protein product, partial [Rotaria magnacalcarata]